MKKTLPTALALITASLLLTSCVTPQSPQSAEGDSDESVNSACPVEVNEDITTAARIAYQHIPNGDLIVKDRGWLEACMPNASIDWVKYNSGGDVIQAFGSNSADIGLAGSVPSVRMFSAPLNLDMKVVWIFDVIGDAESLITQEELSSVAELEGKKIAVPFGSTAQFSLLAAVEDAGLEPTDVEIINLAPDAMLAAWDREEIDAAWVWDPTLSKLKETGSVLLSSAQTAELGRGTYDVGSATTEFVESNPEFMDVWTELQSLAAQEINEDPASAAESIAVQLSISPEEVEAQLPGYIYLTADQQLEESYFGGGLQESLISTAGFLVGQDLIDNANPDDAYRDAAWSQALENVTQ